MEERADPEGFVDIHSHLVPGVDDGPDSLERALEMISAAAGDGTTVMVATPHLFSSHNIIRDIDVVLQKREQAIEYYSRKDLPLRVVPGAEIFFVSDLMKYFERYRRCLTINQGSYFILEFPYDLIFPGLDDFMYQLQTEGYIPIIAHPERNQVIQARPGILYRLVTQGALAQINSGSLLGEFGEEVRAAAWKLIRHHLAHLVASDSHAVARRAPRLSPVYQLLKSNDPLLADRMLIDNPFAVVNDRPPREMDQPRDPEQKTSIFDFLRQKLVK